QGTGGEPEAARRTLLAALEAEQELGRPGLAAAVLAVAACLLERECRDEEAALLLGAVDAANARSADLRLADERERCAVAVTRLRERLGDGLCETLTSTGRTWRVAEALGFAAETMRR